MSFDEDILNFYLITRRSCKKAGTRYNSRGIDDEGNVANFAETEQIVFIKDCCFSHVQIRGSVPVFWEQRGVTVQTKLSRNYDLTNAAFLKHFKLLEKDYERVSFFIFIFFIILFLIRTNLIFFNVFNKIIKKYIMNFLLFL